MSETDVSQVQDVENPDKEPQAVDQGWPRYRSIKVVQALKLAEVHMLQSGAVQVTPDDETYSKITFAADSEFVKRERSQQMGDPGYVVLYQDGFISWSPTSVFESGYVVA